jgi:hypothetical protein
MVAAASLQITVGSSQKVAEYMKIPSTWMKLQWIVVKIMMMATRVQTKTTCHPKRQEEDDGAGGRKDLQDQKGIWRKVRLDLAPHSAWAKPKAQGRLRA